jgi:hypothetical protein
MNRDLRRRSLGFLLAIGVGLTAGGQALAETEMIRVGSPPARMSLLRAGSHRYLRYELKDGKRIAHDIWDRTISFEQKDGRRLLHITQRWDEVNVAPGGATSLEQDSWFDPMTFRPLTHVRRRTVASQVSVTGYRFLDDKAVGLADLADNQQKDFVLPYSETPFNFEYDMELIQTLPLHAGYAANIAFYDAGVDKKADRYTFKVAGSDRISGWDGRPVDCWLVTADYNTGSVQSRWWVDKMSQVVLREESRRDDGSMFIKTLLPPEAADAPQVAAVDRNVRRLSPAPAGKRDPPSS